MTFDDRVRDDLPINLPYDGLIAEAYDVWLPPDASYADRGVLRHAITEGDGPALELGCGNGRLLVGYVQAGLDVEGLDSSADMLAVCRSHLDARDLDAPLHHADWTSPDLGARFATVYNPSGSFLLVHDTDLARATLRAWLSLVRPGGALYLTAGVPTNELVANWEWRLRRSGTRASDGVTFVVHEAVRCDVPNQLQHSIHRHEVWEADGTLRTAFLRRHLMRWWTPEQLAAELRDAGAHDVVSIGDDDGFVTIGHV